MPAYTVKQRAPDILTIAALLAVVVIALGIVFRIIDAAVGGIIIVPLVGAAGVAQFMKAKRFATQANEAPQNKRRERDFQFTTAVKGGTRTIVFATEDILAIAALLAVVILALAIAFRSVETGTGGTIIIALVGAAGIAEFMKAKRSASKDGQA
jgi:hypothetical protein